MDNPYTRQLRALSDFKADQRAKLARQREQQPKSFSVGAREQSGVGISFSMSMPEPAPLPLSDDRAKGAASTIEEMMETCSPSERARLANCWRL